MIKAATLPESLLSVMSSLLVARAGLVIPSQNSSLGLSMEVQLLPMPAPVPNIFCFIMDRELLMLSLLNSVGVPA